MKKQLQSSSKKNNEEKEIKVQISKKQYEKLFHNRPSAAKLIKSVNQKDIYYDTEELYLTNLNRGLRVRCNGDVPQCLEFKSLFFNPYTKNNNPWFIEEITFPFPLELDNFQNFFLLLVRLNLLSPRETTYHSFEAAYLSKVEDILSSAKLKQMIVVNKHRVGYQKDEVQYVFDYIEGLGYFLEIESQREDLFKLLNCLDLENYQIIRNGYNDMLAVTIPSYLPNEVKQRKFKEDPRWNILPGETEMVENMLSQSNY